MIRDVFTKLSIRDYLDALPKVHEDKESEELIKSLIFNYFEIVQHMKETSLYNVFMYEHQLTEPMSIFVYENEKLKKEVNTLRKLLKMREKYKEYKEA